MQDLLILMLLFLLAGYWVDTMRAREIARHACDQACQHHNVQLLDNTVTKQKTWLRRGQSGFIQFCRAYAFEYTDDGDDRQNGLIVMLGKQIIELQMQPHNP